jgi:K+-sensing histidine kinase KdpD
MKEPKKQEEKSKEPLRGQEKYIKFEIRIQDSGLGISPENLSKLFMNFSKLDEHAEGNKRGTGLGLSICKSLIELMGGSVKVESELNVGTTFIMSLQTKCKVVSCKKSKVWIREHIYKNAGSTLPTLGGANFDDDNYPMVSVPAE